MCSINKYVLQLFIYGMVWLISFQCMGQSLSDAVKEFVEMDAPVIALTKAKIIDGTGTTPKENQTLIVEKGKIKALGEAVTIPDGAVIIDLQGKTILPGWVMMHEHMYYPSGSPSPYHLNQQIYSFPKLYLAGGVTTMRTAGSIEPYADLNLRASIEKGEVPGPTMDVTGPYIEGPGLGIPQIKEIRGPDDARKMVSYWAGEGVNSFKVYNRLTKKELKATLEEAHQLNKKVTGHLCSITFREAADLGIDNLEHGFLTSTDFVKDKKENKCPGNRAVMGSLLEVSDKQINELIHYLVQKNIAITSTLTVFETFTPGRPRISDAELDAMLPTTREYYLKRWSRIATSTDSSWRILFKKEMAWEKAFSDAGGLLMAGTDPTGYGGIIPGYSNLRAIELLVEGGFSLEEAIKVGTLNGAIYLNMQNEIGTVELGKEADLIIIDGDPTQDLSQLRKVEMVFKHGVGYNPQKLIEAANGRVGLH